MDGNIIRGPRPKSTGTGPESVMGLVFITDWEEGVLVHQKLTHNVRAVKLMTLRRRRNKEAALTHHESSFCLHLT